MKRRIAAIAMPDVEPGLATTDRPETRWVAPTDLLVDESYQRNLSDQSIKLIRRIVAGFDWRRYKPPIVVETPDGLEVIDGQHTAMAAASNPNVPSILVMVIAGAETSDRAAAFLGHNRDRLNVSTMQMHHAAVTAGDAEALTIAAACAGAGIRILRLPPSQGLYKPRDTVALKAIGTLVRQLGPKRAQAVLQVLSDAECAPIGADAIKAVAHLMSEPQYRSDFRPEDLTVTIRGQGGDALREAQIFGIAHKLPVWRGLAVTWFRHVKKTRAKPTTPVMPQIAAAPVPRASPIPRPAAAPPPKRVVIDRRPRGSLDLGEPAPGRSALDQRMAGG